MIDPEEIKTDLLMVLAGDRTGGVTPVEAARRLRGHSPYSRCPDEHVQEWARLLLEQLREQHLARRRGGLYFPVWPGEAGAI